MSEPVYIVEALRTGVGSFNGSLAGLGAAKLSEHVIRALLAKTQIDPADISEVIMGQVLLGGAGMNPARQASINAGLPIEVPAWVCSQVCGSGLKSVMLGAQSIMSRMSNVVIAGGQESMSQAKHAMHMRNGIKMGDAKMVDTMIYDGLWDVFFDYHMGVTAENVAKKFNITRAMQDEFACKSQNKAEAAQKAGKFKDEIVPIKIPVKKEEVTFDSDEFIRAGTTLDALAKLKPAFDKEGTVTAGNASGLNDGAAAVMLMSESEVKKRGVKPIAKIVSFAQAGVAPEIMGTGPIVAVRKALDRAGWGVSDLDVIEANEAFAAQAIAVNMELGWDLSKVNVNGGAIAIGHPIGASGGRILVTLLHEMKRSGTKKGLATLCIGGGMGVALCVENL